MKIKTNFSELLKELEVIVSKLEGEDVSLENSFEYYKKGMDLAKVCHEKLGVIEKDVLLVTEQGNSFKEAPFIKGESNGQPVVEDPPKVIKKPAKTSIKKEKENDREPSSPTAILPGLFENH